MKKTQFLELLGNIKASWVSFLSIAIFVALGVGLFLGLQWTGSAERQTADQVFNEQDFYDFNLSYVYGFTDSDIEDISNIEGVSQVEGGYTAFTTFSLDGTGHVARVLSDMSQINEAMVVEGVMPTESNEIALDDSFAQSMGVDVGDTITFDSEGADDADGMTYLNSNTYTVTALVNMPSYLMTSLSFRGVTNLSVGSADCFIIAPVSAFDSEAFGNGYSNVYLRCSSLEGLSTFSDEYADGASSMKESLTSLGVGNASARYNSLKDDANAKIAEGQAKVDEGDAQVLSAEAQIADGETQITNSEAQIASGETQVASAEEEIANYEAQIADAEAQISDAEGQLTSAEDQLSAALDELNYDQGQADHYDGVVTEKLQQAAAVLQSLGVGGTQDEIVTTLREILDAVANSGINIEEAARELGVPEVYIDKYVAQVQANLDTYRTFLNSKAQLAEGWNTYYEKRGILDDKEAQLQDAKDQLATGKQQLQDARDQLATGKQQLQDAKDQLATGKQQLQDAKNQLVVKKQELQDAKTQLQEAQDQVDSMAEYSWNVAGRAENTGVIGVKAFSDSVDRLCYSMALVFIIVGLLVCYTNISRIVREQVVNVGTKKALGFRRREITISYLLYSSLAVLLGIVLAGIIATIIVERILIGSSTGRFVYGAPPVFFSLGGILLMAAVELALMGLSTWLACCRMLRRQAVDLLRGEEAPKAKTRFFEKWKLWDKLPLYTQTMVNNFFNDKLRIAATLIGVAGSTMLVVMAMTLYVSMTDSFTVQYDKIYDYDAHVTVDSNVDSAIEETSSIIADAGGQSTPVLRTTFGLSEPDGNMTATTLVVPLDTEAFSQVYHLNNADTGKVASLGDSGVWVSQAYAFHQHAEVGDTVELVAMDGTTYELPIAGIFEYHLNHHEFVMSADYYEEVFGHEPEANTLLVTSNGVSEAQMNDQLQGTDGFFSYTNEYAENKTAYAQFQSLALTVVIIYLALAALMAFMMLTNLTVMFIEEKKRDLIVLMINGYSTRDAKRYIYRDNIALTILGIIIGLLLGMVMGYLAILSVEFDSGFFLHTPSWVACVVAAVVSALFALIINLFALRRIPRFNLTDINRL